jgi:hypothetical protein
MMDYKSTALNKNKDNDVTLKQKMKRKVNNLSNVIVIQKANIEEYT